MKTTLHDQAEHLFRLYGPRNAVLLPSLQSRLDFLNMGVLNLQRCYQKGRPEQYGACLASMFARICAVAETLHKLSLPHYMTLKYPQECAYCQERPCACPPSDRAAAKLGAENSLQMNWCLHEWQEHLAALYREKNKKLGLTDIFTRLFSEALELSGLHIQPSGRRPSELRNEYGLELADTLAWTLALATLLDIDLERVVTVTYSNGCHTCKLTVCDCPSYTENMRKNKKNNR